MQSIAIPKDIKINSFRAKGGEALTGKLNNFFVGTKLGPCPICGETKTLLMLRGGIAICKDCLSICVRILELAQDGVSKGKLIRHFGIEREAHILSDKS